MKVKWSADRPPTKAELRAIRRLARQGALSEGDAVGPALETAKAEYERFHWGRRPRRIRAVDAPDSGVLYELGKLRRVEYETRKGSEHAIYYHDFTEPYPTLTGTLDGRLGPILGGAARVKPRGIVK